MIHITPTSDISQHFKSAGFEACYQITERKPERNSMRNRDASKGKGTLKKKFWYYMDVYKPIWSQNVGEKSSLGTLQITCVEILKITGYFMHASLCV